MIRPGQFYDQTTAFGVAATSGACARMDMQRAQAERRQPWQMLADPGDPLTVRDLYGVHGYSNMLVGNIPYESRPPHE